MSASLQWFNIIFHMMRNLPFLKHKAGFNRTRRAPLHTKIVLPLSMVERYGHTA